MKRVLENNDKNTILRYLCLTSEVSVGDINKNSSIAQFANDTAGLIDALGFESIYRVIVSRDPRVYTQVTQYM